MSTFFFWKSFHSLNYTASTLPYLLYTLGCHSVMKKKSQVHHDERPDNEAVVHCLPRPAFSSPLSTPRDNDQCCGNDDVTATPSTATPHRC